VFLHAVGGGLFRRLVASADVLMGAALFVGFIASLAYTPGAYQDYSREPEDFWLLLLLGALCAIIGSEFMMLGWILWSDERRREGVTGLVVIAAAFSGVLLSGVGLFGCLAVNPRTMESGVIWLPASLLLISSWICRSWQVKRPSEAREARKLDASRPRRSR
jgi:H+/Cl- antiporter ClcA